MSEDQKNYMPDLGPLADDLQWHNATQAWIERNGKVGSGDRRALDVQEGGDHYKNMPLQPVEYIHRNGIGFCEGAVIKYVSRWRTKNGIDDLRKARHFIDLLIELEETRPA